MRYFKFNGDLRNCIAVGKLAKEFMTTQQPEDEDVQKFIKAFDVLMNAMREKHSRMLNRPKIEQTGK